MRYSEFKLVEVTDQVDLNDSPDIERMKELLAAKIKEIPTDPASLKALEEIEDVLASIGAGGRFNIVKNALAEIKDPDVNKSQKLIAKYFMSLEADQKAKAELLTMWKADKLVNINLITTPGQHTIADIVNGYNDNPAIREMTDDLSQIQALGQGKGEFLLSVFSKSISKSSKGDLFIKGKGQVEVKTRDGGAGRFHDQDVRPSQEYQQAVKNFVSSYKAEIEEQKIQNSTGINLAGLIKLYSSLAGEKKQSFNGVFSYVMRALFPYIQDEIPDVTGAIIAGNINQARQRYAVANLNNYIKAKTDDIGILMIDLTTDPYTFIYFTDNESLNAGGLRLHLSTAYPITQVFRNAYPQTHVVKTSQPQ